MTNSCDAWVLRINTEPRPVPGRLERGAIELDELLPQEVLVEPLLVGWEGNNHHAVQRRPIDICAARKEQQVVLGNAGIVRVLEPGAAVHGLREGDLCMTFPNYNPDRFGYLMNNSAFAYDAPRTVGLLAKRTKIRASGLFPIPPGTRHSLAQWAAFAIRYVTAWSNWRVAYGAWRLQVPEHEQPFPQVVGWGGGTTFAELTLAVRHGAAATMIASRPSRFALAKAHGLRSIDRTQFPHIEHDEKRAKEDGYEARYRGSEEVFMRLLHEATHGNGADIFVDYIGGPLQRATTKALARQGVLTTAGWREGMRMSFMRAAACIERHLYVHTHGARNCEVVTAMEYGERTGWMPPIDGEQPWPYLQVPELVELYAAGKVDSYFPLIEVNA